MQGRFALCPVERPEEVLDGPAEDGVVDRSEEDSLGYLASPPNIQNTGENFVVTWCLVLSPNKTASKWLSHSFGLSCTNFDSAREKR